MSDVVLDSAEGRTWYAIQVDNLFSCCETAKNMGYNIEERLCTGFLLTKPNSPEHLALVSQGDPHYWELIAFNYKPDFYDPRIMS